MKIFVSYSTEDILLVKELAEHIRPHATVYFWDESKRLGEDSWQTIYKWIDSSDIILALITDKTVARAMAVGQEIGRAKTRGKMIIPIVSSEVKSSQLGCLKGITFQMIDKNSPGAALKYVEKAVFDKKQQIELRNNLGLIAGIVALVWLSLSE